MVISCLDNCEAEDVVRFALTSKRMCKLVLKHNFKKKVMVQDRLKNFNIHKHTLIYNEAKRNGYSDCIKYLMKCGSVKA